MSESVTDIRNEIVRNASRNMAGQAETALKQLLDEHVPEWTLDDIRKRVTFRPAKNADDWDVYFLDGVAVLELGPIKIATEQKGGGLIQTVSRDVRRRHA